MPRWTVYQGEQGLTPARDAFETEPGPLDRDVETHDDGREGDATDVMAGTAFAAGAALFALDQLVRAKPAWAGAFRMRQALAAAAACAKLLRMREDDRALRDAHHLTRAPAGPGPSVRGGLSAGLTALSDPGPGGRLYRAWRDLARRPTRLASEALCRLAAELGLPAEAASVEPGPSGLSPIETAARATSGVAVGCSDAPAAEAEVLALMAADVALAHALGWPEPVPLLAIAAHDPALRIGPEGRRVRVCAGARPVGHRRAGAGDVRTGADETSLACQFGFALAAARAHARALDLDRRAKRLEAASSGVRTKGADTGLAAILADDAVSAAGLGLGSERAGRRFLDRLSAQGGLRELTGRPTFRLYGL